MAGEGGGAKFYASALVVMLYWLYMPVLEPLTGLSAAELRALVASVLAPAHARRLKQLLRLPREKKLSRAVQAELDTLLEESDRIAVVKAKANHTLHLLES